MSSEIGTLLRKESRFRDTGGSTKARLVISLIRLQIRAGVQKCKVITQRLLFSKPRSRLAAAVHLFPGRVDVGLLLELHGVYGACKPSFF